MCSRQKVLRQSSEAPKNYCLTITVASHIEFVRGGTAK